MEQPKAKKGTVAAIREASADRFERRAAAIWKRIAPACEEMEACRREAARLREGAADTEEER